MKDHPGLRFLAVCITVGGLFIILLSLFMDWTSYCYLGHTYRSSGWELIGEDGHQDMAEYWGEQLMLEPEPGVRLVERVEYGMWFFTALIFLVLIPLILLVTILTDLAQRWRYSFLLYILLFLLTASLLLISAFNLWTIVEANSVVTEAGVLLNTLGSIACLAGSVLFFVFRVKEAPALSGSMEEEKRPAGR